LQDTTFDSDEGIRIGNVYGREDKVERPNVSDWLSSVCHEYKGSFAPEEVDQKLDESIDGKSFIDISYGVDKVRGFYRDQTDPRRDGIDGDPEDD
jgi:hypothetical protein